MESAVDGSLLMSPRITPGARALTQLVNYTQSDYTPEEYIAPDSIVSTHNQPRFGFTNDFEVIYEGSSEDVEDYVKGIIIGAIIILLVSVIWGFAIACLKIAGQKKVGFLAGTLVRPADAVQPTGTKENEEEKGGDVEVVLEGDEQRPSKEDTEDNKIEEAVAVGDTNNAADVNHAEKKFMRKVWTVRTVFILSGIFVITAGALFYAKGIVSFTVSSQLDQYSSISKLNLTFALCPRTHLTRLVADWPSLKMPPTRH